MNKSRIKTPLNLKPCLGRRRRLRRLLRRVQNGPRRRHRPLLGGRPAVAAAALSRGLYQAQSVKGDLDLSGIPGGGGGAGQALLGAGDGIL